MFQKNPSAAPSEPAYCVLGIFSKAKETECLTFALLDKRSPEAARRSALETLSKTKPGAEAILQIATDPAEPVTLRLSALGKLKSSLPVEQVPALLKIITQKSENERVRFESVVAIDDNSKHLAHSDIRGIGAVLTDRLDNIDVRRRIARLFQRAQRKDALEYLSITMSSGDPELARESLTAIWELYPTGGFSIAENRVSALGQSLLRELPNPGQLSGSKHAMNKQHRIHALRVLVEIGSPAAGEGLWKAALFPQQPTGDLLVPFSTRSEMGFWLESTGEHAGKALARFTASLRRYANSASEKDRKTSELVHRYASALNVAHRLWPNSVFRFLPEQLISIVERRNLPVPESKPLFVLVQGSTEGLGRHGYYYNAESDCSAFMEQGYEVRFHECGTRTSILDSVIEGSRKYGAATVINLDGHGTAGALYFSAPRWNLLSPPERKKAAIEMPHTIRVEDVQELVRRGMSIALRPRGHVIYGGCDGGAGGSHNPRNVANGFVPVWQSKNPSGQWACSRLSYGRKYSFYPDHELAQVDFIIDPTNTPPPEGRQNDPISYNASARKKK